MGPKQNEPGGSENELTLKCSSVQRWHAVGQSYQLRHGLSGAVRDGPSFGPATPARGESPGIKPWHGLGGSCSCDYDRKCPYLVNHALVRQPLKNSGTFWRDFAKLHTFSLLGIDAVPVEVEVDVSASAMPKTILVGLPEAAVKESRHRVDRAMVNSGFVRPQDRIVINLAPAELPKQASSFDLPISLGVLAGSGQIASDRFAEYAVVGELSLEGATRSAKGALSMAMAAARQKNLRGIIVPDVNAAEAAVVEDIDVIPVSSLAEAVAFFSGEIDIDPVPSRLDELFSSLSRYNEDYADVRGQEMAKRALIIAAAGSHNLLMLGPPGSGKTMYITRCRTDDTSTVLWMAHARKSHSP